MNQPLQRTALITGASGAGGFLTPIDSITHNHLKIGAGVPPPVPHDLAIASILHAQPALEFAVLIGSQAAGTASAESDWDIALQWSPRLDWLSSLGHTESLRRQLAQSLRVAEAQIDLIDLPRASLAMRATVAEEGKPLKGEDSLAWVHFLRRTWREIEDFYWDKHHAA